MIVNFEEVGASGTKSGVCPGCGKRANRSATFTQTINPFNKDKATGKVKELPQIREELRAELLAWKEKPTWHAKCEPKR